MLPASRRAESSESGGFPVVPRTTGAEWKGPNWKGAPQSTEGCIALGLHGGLGMHSSWWPCTRSRRLTQPADARASEAGRVRR